MVVGSQFNFRLRFDEITQALHLDSQNLEPDLMKPVATVEAPVPNLESKPELSEAEKAELLEQAVQKREKLAESALDMAKMFIQRGKPEIARRRLQQIVEEFDGSAAVTEARTMLAGLRQIRIP